MSRYSVFNRTKQTLLAADVEMAETMWARMKGLIGRSAGEVPAGKGLWIVRCQGIHTIGMSFPIDVVYLDSSNRVLCLHNELPPFRLPAPRLKARSVLELGAGTLRGSRTAVGDVLEIRQAHEAREIARLR